MIDRNHAMKYNIVIGYTHKLPISSSKDLIRPFDDDMGKVYLC